MTRNNLCIISISYVDNWPKSCFLRPIQAVRKKSKHSLTSIHTLTFGTVLGIDIGSTAITSIISAAFGISYIITISVTYPSHICTTGFKKMYLMSGDTKLNTIFCLKKIRNCVYFFIFFSSEGFRRFLKIRFPLLLTFKTKKNQRPRLFIYAPSWS